MATNSRNKKSVPGSGKLILVRHAESEWNVLGKWTGQADVHLTEKGRQDARLIGEALQDLTIDLAYYSEHVRTLETLQGLLSTAQQQPDLPHERHAPLNERDYGEYTGLDKWQVLDRLGKDKFDGIRRAWDHPIPGGETLQMVHARTVPFYESRILPQLQAGKTVLVVSHGNTLRTLIKHLEAISDADIAAVEMPFDRILLFSVTPEGRSYHKEERAVAVTPPHA